MVSRWLAAMLLCAVACLQVVLAAQDDEDALKSAPPERVELLYPYRDKPLARTGHWSFQMSPGDYIVKDGVLLEKGTSLTRPSVMTGVTEQPPQQLLGNLSRSDELDSSARARVRADWLDWYALYFGRTLSQDSQQKLRRLYQSTAARTQQLIGNLSVEAIQKLSSERRDELHRKMAERLLDFLVEERALFAGSENAELLRYRKKLRPLKRPDVGTRERLTSELEEFLSGRYTKNVKRVPPNVPNQRYRAIPSDRRGAYLPVPMTLPPVLRPSRAPCPKLGTSTERRTIEGPFTIAAVGRVFVSEHPVTGSDWEDIGLPRMYHTSIIGGLWEIVQTREVITHYECMVMGEPPVERGKSEEVTTRLDFNRWKVANGCASEPEHDDTLQLAYEFGGEGSTPDQVLKVLRGVRADKNGKRCRTRYGAFPNGGYGVNWVCHQDCNGFAHTKWAILPISYVESYAQFGDLGNLGITDIRGPCQCGPLNEANHCCVPGESCCYNTVWGQGSGKGYGLSIGWHPKKNWIDTECQFNSDPVVVPGFDGEILNLEVTVEGTVDQ